MAAQTEQNLGDDTDDVKVIAVKLPHDLQERLLAFPLFHALRERFPKADLHFITPKKDIEVLNLLPFTAYYHELDEGEIKTVFDVHRWSSTAKIFNTDIFVSLTNSFSDAFMGTGLRAKKKVGFSDGWKTMILTHKTPRPRGHHVTEDFYALYGQLIGGSPNSKIKCMSRELKPVIADWNEVPYVAINLSPLRGLQIEEEFVQLINEFENQRIVLFSSDEPAKAQMVIEPFMARLSKKNSYINFIQKDWIELAKMLAFSKGVITFNGPCASVAAYVGAKTLALYDSEDPQRYGPFYFLSDVMVMGVNDPTLTNNASGGVVKGRKTFNMAEVHKRALDFFKI